MSPDDVARRHEEMLGYELVDYAEVALPVWQLSLEAISIAHRRFSPIQEYVLRAIHIGLTSDELSGFLGLDGNIIDGAIAQLVSDRLLRVNLTESDSNPLKEYVLSDEGTKALHDEGIAVPVEDQFQVFFDGIHRLPTSVSQEQIALPRDADSGLLVELPAIPPNKPTVSDLKVTDVQRVLAQQSGGRAEFGKDIISLKRISRYRRLFRRGIGLVFKGMQNRGDLRLKIIVGGVRAEDVERQFADQGGLSRPGFLKAFSDAYLNANLRKHLGPDMAAALLDEAESRARQRAYSIVKLKMSSIERKLMMVTAGELPREEAPSTEQVRKAKADLQQAKEALSQPRVRSAAVYEQGEFFRTVFSTAKRSISMSTLGLSDVFVNANFLSKLEGRLRQGLLVSIFVDQDVYERDRIHSVFGRPYIEMQRLADKFDVLKLNVHGESRYFHLAMDDQLLLVSNRSFLSNSGRIRTFEQYSGYFVQEVGLIRAYLDRVRAAK
jgi:hypothetical protein